MTAASRAHAGGSSTLIGAVVGLAVAVVIGYGFYRGARVINLRIFFTWTGVALVFIAAGLVANAAHELIEAGLIPIGTGIAFDISGILPHSTESGNLLGQLLRAIFGYSSTPEWGTLIAWVAYLGTVLTLYLRPARHAASAGKATEHRPVST